jgi:hypothetical protein
VLGTFIRGERRPVAAAVTLLAQINDAARASRVPARSAARGDDQLHGPQRVSLPRDPVSVADA